jgi:putative nucleotidyltransferase with HDIG domain
MRNSVRVYVGAVIVSAVCAASAVYALAPTAPADSAIAVLLLSVLALLAELLGFLLPRAARGSLSFTAYVAMGILVPGWPALVGVFAVKAVTGTAAKAPLHKSLFNVAAYVLALAIEILTFRALGGVGLLSITPTTLRHVTLVSGGPGTVAFASSYLVNTILVSGAIAIESRASVVSVWRELKLASVGLDLLVAPVIFVFAWVYAAYGPVAAATLWVPILGLRQLHKTNLELAQTNQELLELMVKSLEARDPYTSGHSRRVALYSLAIARAIGVSERELERIGRAALLHDVGKIHEKYASVLSKTDKLSPEEWALIQEHAADGAELVATMTHLSDIVLSVRHHHENWDGTGYPDRLAGELIPIESRIIRFADTIDAMTTERPYRGPLTEPEVRAEVVRCRGTQFDPQIADRLLSSPLWFSLFSSPAIGIVEASRARFSVIGAKRRSVVSEGVRSVSGG